MPRYDLVLYDCDGTLYNTYPGVRANFENMLRELGRPAMPADYDWNRCIGPLLEHSLQYELGFAPEDVPLGVQTFRATYADIGVNGSVLYDGMLESIQRLLDAGVKVGVASSKMQKNLDATLAKDGITHMFSCVVGPTAENPITKAQTIEVAAERMFMPKERVLMLGDTHYDATGAQSVGVDFAAAMWGFGKPEDFDAYPCVLRADTPNDVADFVLGEK